MTESSDRREAILSGARDHPIVNWTLQGLDPQDDGTMTASRVLLEGLTNKLANLEPGDDLLTAVFGLVELGSFLRGQAGSPAAGDAILIALAGVNDAVAASTADWTEEELEALRDDRFAAFSGAGGSSAIEERKPPSEGQVQAGPLAAASLKGIKED